MTATSSIGWRSFSLHKDGNRPDEYEDAFAGNPKLGRFAVADGATESSFAALWAKLLVDSFVGPREGLTFLDLLVPLRQRWAEAVDHLELDWFGEEKRDLGAFATFLGLSLKKPRDEKDGRWKAVAVGDCCLFQVRAAQLVRAFPMNRSADFGNRPPLLGSRSAAGLARSEEKLGRWRHGDCFFLMSDALAEWFLRRHEEQRKPWESLLRRLGEANPASALTAYVEQRRAASDLKNDDVTLVVIEP